MNRSPVLVYFDDEGFPVGLKANNAAETILGVRVSLPAPDGPLAMPGGTTAEIVLATITIPGGLMGPKGALNVHIVWSCANTANAKTLRARLAGQMFMGLAQANQNSGEYNARIKNRATNVQVANTNPLIGGSNNAIATFAIDTQQDQLLTITGQLGTAGEAMAVEAITVEIDPGY